MTKTLYGELEELGKAWRELRRLVAKAARQQLFESPRTAFKAWRSRRRIVRTARRLQRGRKAGR